MFIPSAAIIKIRRSQPTFKSVEAASRIAKRRNRLVTEKVYTQDRLKSPQKKNRIAKKVEFDMRVHKAREFIDEYNFFRQQYVNRENEWTPKTASQLTCIEKIEQICLDQRIDLRLFIGSSFKFLAWKPATPALQQILSRGLEHYDEFVDDVIGDLEGWEYTGGYGNEEWESHR